MRSALIDAHRRLGILQGIGSQIVDEELFISMYVRKEALFSSQMRGTQPTLENILTAMEIPKDNVKIFSIL